MALLIHAFLRVTFDTAELTGCVWSAVDALRLRHVPSPAIRFPERAEGVKGPKCIAQLGGVPSVACVSQRPLFKPGAGFDA